MTATRLTARADDDPEQKECFLVRAPTVGVIDDIPPQGAFLDSHTPVVWIQILGRKLPVFLPRNVLGRVVHRFVEGRSVPVQYNQPLFRLSTIATTDATQGVTHDGSKTSAAEQGLVAVKAPSDGIFYRRPSPDSPAYVQVGDTVTRGTVIGLVEVMKSFNKITYGGAALPESGTVVAIQVEDSAEVRFGQPLMLIRP